MTPSNPLVTIVIPAYNHEKYVAQAIKSVINQHYKNWELIVIDDGSTDATGQICDGFAGHDQIQVIHQSNSGLSNVLNKALDLAKGSYFGFLPSDDMFYPEKLLVQVDFLENHPELAGVGGQQTLIDASGQPIDDEEMKQWFSYIPSSRPDFLLKLLERNFVPAPSMLLKTDLVKKAGGFDPDLRFMQDYDLWFRLLKSHDMKLLPRPLIFYRWHGGNLTYRATDETEEERGRVFEKAAKLLEITDLYPELWTELRPEVIALCRVDLHKRLSVNPTPNFEEIHGIFDEKFTVLWRKRKEIDIPRQSLKKLVPACHIDTAPPAVILEVTSLDRGGLEQVVHDLATGLWKNNVPVTVVCVREGGLTANRLKEKGIKVEILPLNSKEDAYRHIIRESKTGIINSHYSSFGARLALEQGIPFVSTVHNIYAWQAGFEEQGIRELDHLTCHYVAVSEDVKSFLTVRFGIDPRKISVIPNGLNIRDWEEKQKKALASNDYLQYQDNDYIFLTTAAISRLKGQDRIVRAMAKIAPECPNAKAVFVGPSVDKAFEAYLKNLVKELNIEGRVSFHPFEQNVAKWYLRANAFVLVSLFEGWSISMLEAMYAGLPIIMTDVAGARTVAAESAAGVFIKPPYKNLWELEADFLERFTMVPNDPMVQPLAETMKDFYLDRQRWKEAGLKNKKLVGEKYTLDIQVHNYQKLFNKVMLHFGAEFVEFFNDRRETLEKALEFSQRTIEKVYESQRQGYWLHTLSQQLHEAWDQLNRERHNLYERINNLNGEIERLRAELNAVYNSRGWKFLESVRKIKGIIKK